MSEVHLLTTAQTSKHLGVAVQTLARWRVYGGGPEFVKLGSLVRYDVADLSTWIAGHRRRSTADTDTRLIVAPPAHRSAAIRDEQAE